MRRTLTLFRKNEKARGSAKARQCSRRLPSASAVEATEDDVEARTSTSVPRSTPWNVCKILQDVVDTPFASCGWKGAQAREVLFHTRRMAERTWVQRIHIATACLLQDRGRPHAFPRSSCTVPPPPGILRRDVRARTSRGCVAHGRRHGRDRCNWPPMVQLHVLPSSSASVPPSFPSFRTPSSGGATDAIWLDQ